MARRAICGALLAAATAGCVAAARAPEGRGAGAAAPAPAAITLRLWPGTPPGPAHAHGTGTPVVRPPDPVRGAITRITDIGDPTITLYRPAHPDSRTPAVLVFPGGGYQLLATDIEGTEICDWLTESGIACALVKYRVPQPNDSTRYLEPLQDAQRAMGLVREHAGEWGIGPGRVGVLGFSAGGHVAAVLSNHFARRAYAPLDSADALSCRPDFAMLVYPAYLVRGKNDARLSPLVEPSAETPPTFLAQALDDPIGPENSASYAMALDRAGVPAELHLYATGGHGYGMRKQAGEVAAAWPGLALRWLQARGVVGTSEVASATTFANPLNLDYRFMPDSAGWRSWTATRTRCSSATTAAGSSSTTAPPSTAPSARYLRITNLHAAGGGKFALRGLRVFGRGGSAPRQTTRRMKRLDPRPALLLAALAPAPACVATLAAQAPAPPRLLTFPDTASVRVEVTLAGAAERAGEAVRGTITDAATGAPLWRGELGRLVAQKDGSARAEGRVAGVHPRRWSPQSPHLYRLSVTAAGDTASVRFGFRRVEERDGRVLLNGRPIFLRGNAINPPERQVPDSLDENPRFVRDYLRYLKGQGVNIIRLTRTSQAWLDGADEVGMMIFQGNYGRPKSATASRPPSDPFEESIRWYEEDVLGPLVNHPSVVIYVLANEQASDEIPYLSSGAGPIQDFLTRAYATLRQWDSTRLYIGNAGYGFGRSGDICDIHRYWGWYYNSFLSFYTLRDPAVCWRTDRVQPITLSENTGNYTGPDGRYNLVPNTKQPASQLNWTGHAPEREQASRALAYQAWMAKQAIEITRRTREENPYLAGLMPFSIIFHRWAGIDRFAEMGPKPIAQQYRVSYQPVLLSWELWTPQVYAGGTLRPVAHLVNDSESGEALRGVTLHYRLVAENGAVRLRGSRALPDIPYYGATSTPLAISLPATLPTGSYTLRGWVLRGADTLSRNETSVFVAERGFAGRVSGGREVVVYDPIGSTRNAFRTAGIPFREIRTLAGIDPARQMVVIGADAWDDQLARGAKALQRFVAGGGRVLLLRQRPERFDDAWLPTPIEIQSEPLDHSLVFPPGRPYRNGMAVNPERPDHPALAGVDRDRLFLWSDFTGWNEKTRGFPEVYPVTQGFVLKAPDALAHAAILADYGHGLQGVALAELFSGSGSVIVSGFDLVDRAGLDPVADRLLLNLVRYQSGPGAHLLHPLVTAPIVWGDYESEQGLVVGVYNGLLVNGVPIVPKEFQAANPVRVDSVEGWQIAGGAGGWNTKPSIQYVPRGRRPFGPYGFTSGGSERLAPDAGPRGMGTVWMRIPAGRTAMTTRVWNPADRALELEITVNGTARSYPVAAGQTVLLTTPLASGTTDVAVTFRGDRRLVLLQTDFTSASDGR